LRKPRHVDVPATDDHAYFFPFQRLTRLLERVLETIILLAASFSADKHSVHITVDVDARTLRVCLDLETLFLSEAAAADFFKMESTARCVSPAESLGLAPVAVNSLISAFGGEMRLFKGEKNTGLLEALFIKEQNNHGQHG
jgi:K+-sensing histidine kinase KdpD